MSCSDVSASPIPLFVEFDDSSFAYSDDSWLPLMHCLALLSPDVYIVTIHLRTKCSSLYTLQHVFLPYRCSGALPQYCISMSPYQYVAITPSILQCRYTVVPPRVWSRGQACFDVSIPRCLYWLHGFAYRKIPKRCRDISRSTNPTQKN